MTLRVIALPCLQDNYAFLLIDEKSKRAIVVDPSEAEPVQAALQAHALKLHAIWLTHHHWDHIGGVETICNAQASVEVWGSQHDQERGRIPKQTRALRDQEQFEWAGYKGSALHVPGHTLGAIAYHIDGNLFSGDTLFLAGCGRVFEGTMSMMAESMVKLRSLDAATRIWCGHEYTLNNLRFAAQVEPDNSAIARELEHVSQLRSGGQPTVPGTISREIEVNPFFRFDLPIIMQGRDATQSFAALRQAKDSF